MIPPVRILDMALQTTEISGLVDIAIVLATLLPEGLLGHSDEGSETVYELIHESPLLSPSVTNVRAAGMRLAEAQVAA